MPGHIKHQKGDTFSEVYLSYLGRIPAREFLENFAPDSRFFYRREEGKIPARFIRAYHLRDPKSGRDGPWLAGMTLDPAVVSEAWCHQRDYVCFIEEFGGRPVRPGGSFSAAFIVGFFDSIEEMNEVYDRHAGRRALAADAEGWRLLAETTPEEGLAARLEWFQDQKLGLLIHWGPYSQWGCIESWPLVEEDRWARPDDLLPWVERGKDLEGFRRDYRSLPRTFAPSRFDPRSWAAAARKAGMRYLVFTTKHHDGFSMFDTRLSEYRITAPDCPHSRSPRADVTRALFDGFRAEGMGIGAYFSKADWNSPDYWSPEAPAHTRSANYDTLKEPERWARFVRFVHGQVEELLSGYGPIDILWLDAGQVRPPREDLQMDRLAAMARERQPDLLIVDRTVGGKYENYRTPEQTVPEKPPGYVWESCITMGSQWSYKPGDRYKPARELIQLLVDVVSKGGNLLLNIGPEPTGELPQEALGRLGEMAEWMAVNSEAIHGTRAIAPYRVGRVAFTRRGRDLYAIRLAGDGEETLPARIELPPLEVELDPAAPARFLGAKEPLRIVKGPGGNAIEIPEAVQKAPPCRHAWVFKLRLLP
jgi:alpha-L-fucosidase